MTKLVEWVRGRPALVTALGWLACALLAALFLLPAIAKGGLGPGDMLLGMTPWAQYRDRFPHITAVANPQLDVIQQYFPWRVFASGWLRQGILPIWNPHTYCGQPFIGNVLSAVFYPFCWLTVVCPVGVFFLLSAWSHLTLLGGGMWLLLRAHRLSVPASLTGAVVMMFNGYVIGWLDFANLSQWTFAWAPLLLWLWLRGWQTGQVRWLAGVVIGLALSLFGGHIQVAFYVWLAWLVWAVGHVLADRRPAALLVWVCLPAVLGGLAAAGQLLPAFVLARLSGRAGQSYASLAELAWPARMLICLLVPWFYGHNALSIDGSGNGGLFWGPYANGIEASVSAGATALALALVAVAWRRERAVWLLVAIALLGVALALRLPIYWLFYQFVPVFTTLRGLSRAFCLWALATSALAGFGVEALLTRERLSPCPRRVALGLVLGAGAALVAAWAADAAATTGPDSLTAMHPALTGYVAGQSLLALACVAAVAGVAFAGRRRRLAWALGLVALGELWLQGGRMHPGVDPAVYFFETPETELLRTVARDARMVGVPADEARAFLDWMPMNTPMAYGLSSPAGSESLSLETYRQLTAEFCEPGWEPALASPLLDLVGVRYALSRADLSAVPGWRRIGGDRVGVFVNDEALPLVFSSRRFESVPGETMLRRMTSPSFDATLVLLAGQPSEPVGAGGVEPMAFRQLTPQRVAARGPVDGAMVVVHTSPPLAGWEVWQDHRPLPLELAWHTFSAVRPEGAGEAWFRWVYRPLSLRLGLFLSLLALVGLLGWQLGWPSGECRSERTAGGPPGA